MGGQAKQGVGGSRRHHLNRLFGGRIPIAAQMTPTITATTNSSTTIKSRVAAQMTPTIAHAPDFSAAAKRSPADRVAAPSRQVSLGEPSPLFVGGALEAEVVSAVALVDFALAVCEAVEAGPALVVPVVSEPFEDRPVRGRRPIRSGDLGLVGGEFFEGRPARGGSVGVAASVDELSLEERRGFGVVC